MSISNFFEPKPLLDNIYKIVEDKKDKLHRRKPIIRRRPEMIVSVTSILGKRKLEDAFGQGMHDYERYGQEIPPDFFNTNRGHNAFPSHAEGL